MNEADDGGVILLQVGYDPITGLWYAVVNIDGKEFMRSPACKSEKEAIDQRDVALEQVRVAFAGYYKLRIGGIQ